MLLPRIQYIAKEIPGHYFVANRGEIVGSIKTDNDGHTWSAHNGYDHSKNWAGAFATRQDAAEYLLAVLR